jgi:predicted RNA-binding Zn ribbon-like protein
MSAPEFLTLGDDPALDFLNTLSQAEDGPHDLLTTDEDVLAWLRLMGFLHPKEHASFKRGALVAAARDLREVIRKLVLQKKSGKRVDVTALNGYLEAARYRLSLVRGASGQFEVVREYEKSTPEQLLTQVAEAAAELLSNGDFELVRKCESDSCILWFYDRTKAHRRRWCSMAVCGNRHKVASFRARQRGAEAHD